jgi:hypothetical protein
MRITIDDGGFMRATNTVGLISLGLIAGIIFGCGGGSGGSSGATATAPSGVIGGIDTGVKGAGNGMGSTPAGGNAVAALDKNFLDFLVPTAFASGGGIDSVCDQHADPTAPFGARLNNSDADYPAMVFFCKVAKNSGDPDSVQGSYALVRGISCMMERAGIIFDGVDHVVTATVDTHCFTAQQVGNMGVGTMTITVNASRPAAFNPHYDAGFTMDVPGFGVFKLAAKVTGQKLEFIALEDQTATTANKTGAYAASFDRASGLLQFESRHDRFFADSSGPCGNSCGWSRHLRLVANLIVDANGAPTGLTNISGVFATLNGGPLSGSYNSEIDTISGDTTNGIKARTYMYSGATIGHLDLGSSFTETTNTQCYTSSVSNAGTCGPGVAWPTGAVPFNQYNAYTPPSAWLSGLTNGLAFTSVTTADVE